MKKIRNFCIIAHIDHGKSTLADRMLEITGTVDKREMKEQVLDQMDLEKERGITIKMQAVRMKWKDYVLNLIDTPGHVDFSFEVSRSLAACEGAILVVDATQGVEAQTLANLYLAIEQGLEIIVVLNKIDLPSSNTAKVTKEVEEIIGVPESEMIFVSAKTGENVDKVLDTIIAKIPEPKEPEKKEGSKALIFDSVFDNYRGVILFVRLFAGKIKKGEVGRLLSSKKKVEVLDCGFFAPKMKSYPEIQEGEVGFVVSGLKTIKEARVGDTLYIGNMDKPEPLLEYQKAKPMLFASFFPVEASDYKNLEDALDKLSLNDASIQYNKEYSPALGNGFRIGLLGMLHLDIVQERLEREFDLDLIVAAPSVPFEILKSNGEVEKISSAAHLPDLAEVNEIREPWAKLEIVTNNDTVGGIIELCTKRRGKMKNMKYLDQTRVLIDFEIPLSAIITNFYDDLKSISSGYASMSNEFLEYRAEKLVKLDIMVAGEKVDALAQIVHRDEARQNGAPICKRLKDIIPRQNFPIALQAAIGSQIIARETIAAYRKDVTAGLYGGDVSRKQKLLKKQKKGKKRMKQMGRVEVPQEAFLSILKRD